VDDVVSSSPVFFQTRPTTHRQGPRRPPWGMSRTCSRSHRPPSLLSQIFKSLGLTHFFTHFFPIIIYILLPTHWYCACCRVFWYSSLSLSALSITQSRLIEPEVEMQLNLVAITAAKVVAFLWFISLKTFPIAGSCTQEDIRNQGVEFRASVLFSLPTIYIKYVPLLAIMRYWGDTKSPPLHLLEQDNASFIIFCTYSCFFLASEIIE